jgi:hypothetical protein
VFLEVHAGSPEDEHFISISHRSIPRLEL